MAGAASARPSVSVQRGQANHLRHTALVRITHWVSAVCVLALLVSGAEIVASHPRFYWGETGNVATTPLFRIPIPSSRSLVPTGYDYVLPDQNGWSRALHFQTAWLIALTGVVYVVAGLATRHFRRDLMPRAGETSWHAIRDVVAGHLAGASALRSSASYNPLQKMTYLLVVFVLLPGVIWTGLAMSPAFTAFLPISVNLLGGQQSARTLHFFVSLALLLFLLIHVAMVIRSGFRVRMRGMITGRADAPGENA